MKLERIRVSGFDSFLNGHIELQLGDGLNVLIGPNNCGKGTVLRILRFALESASPAPSTPHSDGTVAPSIVCEFSPTGSSLSTKAITAVTRYLDDLGMLDEARGRISFGVATDSEGSRVFGFGGAPLEEDGDPELLESAVTALRNAVGLMWIPATATLEEVLSDCLRLILDDRSEGEHSRVLERLSAIHQRYREDLDACLFDSIEEDISMVARDLFPEVDHVEFEPDVGELMDSIGKTRIDVRDSSGTSLVESGSGLRAVAGLALAEHLSERSERSLVCLFEEPEAFLHPGAQEHLSARLEQLASHPNVTVLATSESPFLLPRSSRGQVISLKRVPPGRTVVTSSTPGDQFAMRSSSDLFSDAALAGIFDRAARIRDGATGIVLVEGWTDEQYLRIAARKLGLDASLEGLAIVSADGATKVAMEAIVIRAETSRPMLVIFDGDEAGRSARSMLTSRFHFRGDREAVLYGEMYPEAGELAEAEDLFAPELLEQFVQEFGEDVIRSKTRRDDRWHYDIDQEVKGALPAWIEAHAEVEHLAGWRALIENISERVGQET